MQCLSNIHIAIPRFDFYNFMQRKRRDDDGEPAKRSMGRRCGGGGGGHGWQLGLYYCLVVACSCVVATQAQAHQAPRTDPVEGICYVLPHPIMFWSNQHHKKRNGEICTYKCCKHVSFSLSFFFCFFESSERWEQIRDVFWCLFSCFVFSPERRLNAYRFIKIKKQISWE